jgi:hypothetical protein
MRLFITVDYRALAGTKYGLMLHYVFDPSAGRFIRENHYEQIDGKPQNLPDG